MWVSSVVLLEIDQRMEESEGGGAPMNFGFQPPGDEVRRGFESQRDSKQPDL